MGGGEGGGNRTKTSQVSLFPFYFASSSLRLILPNHFPTSY